MRGKKIPKFLQQSSIAEKYQWKPQRKNSAGQWKKVKNWGQKSKMLICCRQCQVRKEVMDGKECNYKKLQGNNEQVSDT